MTSNIRPRVLLVEDDPDLLAVLAEVLARQHYNVTPCANARDALRSIDGDLDGWHAVVTDQSMPGLSGIELIRRIRSLLPELPCLLCTGYGDLVDEADALEAGVAAILRKPVGIAHLVDCLARAIAGNHANP